MDQPVAQSCTSMTDDRAKTRTIARRRLKAQNIDEMKHILASPISILLICVPFGILSPYVGWSESVTFWLNFVAMIPLAKILGDATEELADQLKNDTISGLINATFGNAVEMIMTITFLHNGEYLVVQASMLGSVLSNMLLVMGMSFLCGGLFTTPASVNEAVGNQTPLMKGNATTRSQSSVQDLYFGQEREQKYSMLGAMVNTTMLLLCCLILCLVTVFSHTRVVSERESPEELNDDILAISRYCSIFIVMAYVAYIVFELYTHPASIAEAEKTESEPKKEGLTLTWSIALLLATTVAVAVCSEFLTDALEGALKDSGMGKEFLGIILLPIVGNACEHAAAVRFALEDKAGLSVGIAIGSSVQIALFVVPFSVLVGWAMGDDANGHNMNLNFGVLDVTVLTLSVLVLLAIVVDGKSNWLEGYLLCTAYVMIAVLYWFVPDKV